MVITALLIQRDVINRLSEPLQYNELFMTETSHGDFGDFNNCLNISRFYETESLFFFKPVVAEDETYHYLGFVVVPRHLSQHCCQY